ncbi:MAG: flagellar biosynthesis protein [Rubrivivax sp.]|nr:flagellar biosynthesis protein [Rubrivivax sp.]
MTSLSEAGFRGFPNVPAPPGSKAGASYSRIIPAEELGPVASWQPGSFGGPARPAPGRAAAVDGAAAEPTAEQWQQRIQEARKAGYQDGYRDGLVGLENFKQSHAAQLARQLGQLLQGFERQWAALEPQMAQALARTAVLLARQVLHHELRSHPEHVSRLAQDATAALMHSARRVSVHVHPDDLELVKLGAGEALESRGARVVADAALQRGGCLVHSDIGSVDATLATRWAAAAASLGSGLPWDDEAPAEAGPAAADTGEPGSTP